MFQVIFVYSQPINNFLIYRKPTMPLHLKLGKIIPVVNKWRRVCTIKLSEEKYNKPQLTLKNKNIVES